MSFLSVGLVACLITVFLIPILARRHASAGSTPRIGGLALAAALLVAGGLAARLPIGTTGLPGVELWPALAGLGVIFLVGGADDLRSLPPLVKLSGQIGAASLAWALGLRAGFLPDGVANYLFTVFCLVGGANALNLIDGLDGLAGGVAAVAAGALFFMARDAMDLPAACLAASLGGAALAFLWFNLPPARTWLGDAGSNLLGFGLAATALLLSRGSHGFGDFSAGILMLAVPIVETATTIVRRVLRGRTPLRGDLDHIHHRLLRQGWTLGQILVLHTGTTLGMAALILVSRSGGLAPATETLVSWSALAALLTGGAIYRIARPALLGIRRPRAR